VADGTRLLSGRRGNPSAGSNPALSASKGRQNRGSLLARHTARHTPPSDGTGQRGVMVVDRLPDTPLAAGDLDGPPFQPPRQEAGLAVRPGSSCTPGRERGEPEIKPLMFSISKPHSMFIDDPAVAPSWRCQRRRWRSPQSRGRERWEIQHCPAGMAVAEARAPCPQAKREHTDSAAPRKLFSTASSSSTWRASSSTCGRATAPGRARQRRAEPRPSTSSLAAEADQGPERGAPEVQSPRRRQGARRAARRTRTLAPLLRSSSPRARAALRARRRQGLLPHQRPTRCDS
jgi:hypothetical protein